VIINKGAQWILGHDEATSRNGRRKGYIEADEYGPWRKQRVAGRNDARAEKESRNIMTLGKERGLGSLCENLGIW